MLTGKRVRVAIAALGAAAVVVAGVVVGSKVADRGTRELCAQLPDSAGLYSGNAVNIRGVRIGSVTGVQPDGGHVTVRMRVDDRPLSSGMSVVAVNNSVLADRRLELVGADARGQAPMPTDSCVPLARGFTPISISTAFGSFTTMFDEIGGPGKDSTDPVGNLLDVAAGQLDGTGADLNKTIANLAGFMSDPNDFLAQMRSVFDNLAVLSDVADENWDSLKQLGTNAADLTYFMGSLFKSFVFIFDGLGESGPGLDDLLTNVAPPMLGIVKEYKPLISVGLDRIDDLTAMLKELPGIAKSLQTSMNTKAGSFQVSVALPRVRARTPDSRALCALINATRPGGCDPKSPSTANVDLGALVTRMIQGGIR